MAVQRDKVIANAEKLVAKGKIEAAIKEYERLLEENQNDVNTLNRVGDLWVRINRTDEAVKVFTKIADSYGRDGFYLKAIAIYKKINKLDPSRLDIYAKLADLYAKQGLAMEAKSQYQVLADYYLKHADPANALNAYRKIAELDPNSINVHVKLADLYSQNNQTAEALKEYDRVGKMLLKRGMLDEALQVFRKALKIDSGNIDLAESLVTTLLEAKDYNNAVQLLESTLEANRQNPKLVNLLGRTYLAKGDLDQAREVLRAGVAANPTDPALRETLADLFLRQGAPDEALRTVGPLVDSLSAKSDRGAVDLINRILKTEPLHTPSLEKLVQVYTRLREETNIITALNGLAEAHIATKNYEAAMVALEDLIKREPQSSQYREKMNLVRRSQGLPPLGAAATPAPQAAPPKAAPPPPPPASLAEPVDELPALELEMDELSMEVDMPMDLPEVEMPVDFGESDMGGFESGTGVSDFEESDQELTIDLEGPAEALGMDVGVSSSALPLMEAEVADFEEMPAMEAPEPAGEDLDFITEHMTEAEVFAKYGLAEKAIEHLRSVIGRVPSHYEAHEKLIRIYFEEGQTNEARDAAREFLSLLRDRGDSAMIDKVTADLSARGLQISPASGVEARPAAAAGRTPTAAGRTPVPAATKPAPPPPPPQPAKAEEPPALEIDFEESAEFEVPDFSEPELPIGAELPISEEALLPLDEELAPPEAAATGASPFDYEAPLASGPAIEELGEIDFYIDNQLTDEARRKLDSLLARYPGDPELAVRQDRLNAAASPTAASLSAADIEAELLSAIPDDDDIQIIAPPPPPVAAAPPPQPAAEAADEGNLFADEDDFFDLAAELEDELVADTENISLSEEEQSLEEIFREFKKGVEQQLDSEDYDTHYNLGIAYKEMGLIDEAIGEFQLASKDPKRTIECCSMLGLCFLEKGMPQLAIKWYRKGIEVPEISEEEHLGLLYDLGAAYLEVGDMANAQKAFVEIYGINSNYRDIVSRIKQVEDVNK